MDHKTELLPCPFCGTAMRIESNRDWHRLIGEHSEKCVFLDPETMMVPAKDDQLALIFEDWNTRAPAKDVRTVRDVPVVPELTSDLREILGRPNFTCHFIAKALRLMDFDIPQKSEEEQAATIYWMLGHYFTDPVNWRDAASAELKAGAPAPPALQ